MNTYCFLGPEGTFTHTAAMEMLGAEAALVPAPTVEEALVWLRAGQYEGAVVPFENSVRGYVPNTLEALLAGTLNQVIGAEKIIDVSFTVYRRAHDEAALKGVASHPFALDQCSRFIREHGLDTYETPSTAAALRDLAEEEHPGWGAIGAPGVGHVYGLARAQDHVEDRSGGQTRFILLGAKSPPRTGADRTVFIVRPGRRGGAVVEPVMEALTSEKLLPVSLRGVPVGTGLGQYAYLVEVAEHIACPGLQRALDRLLALDLHTQFLGSFPVDPTRNVLSDTSVDAPDAVTLADLLAYIE